MRILFSGGGTGGHVYPILTVAAALKTLWLERAPHPDAPLHLRYAGTAEGVEADLAARAGLDFTPIAAGQIRIRRPLKLARNALRMARGIRQADALMRAWRPDVAFVTGGYVCGPVVWAAARHDVPVLIYLPDITPGLGVQRLARHAAAIAVSFPEVAAHFQGYDARILDTGYPVRPELRRRSMTKTQARLAFHLSPHLPTLLTFGGSRGARAINQALAAALPHVLQRMQVIHISGELDFAEAQKRASGLSLAQRERYRLFPYLHDEMVAALHAADLAVARAGASTLGEFPALGLPAILVPLPISGGHQRHNARYLADRGAAIIVENDAMPTELLPAIQNLMTHPEGLQAMSRASAALARPRAAEAIATALLDLGGNLQTRS
ncbi:MAG TPA: UDP-N-acetylglucosamine--N-acetylmuramyl-(pentapeptide) pyrophosphoryl-undecaprenol N-acetylglucosamine transferase [Anaerolineae bacterium]|nr:UDP-N-acetylglucosamine--N-acetylmuramyl-(pentapeptide) pyrophosphoryl-undecaprenol N-acetylglucosamine transferase [Anaerolineae bacterium]